MRRLTRDFYIPVEGKFAKNVEKSVYEDLKVEVYTYENSAGQPALSIFGGKRSKPDASYYYTSVESRDKAVANYLESAKKSFELKAKYRAERKKEGRGLEVGDYLVCSWGYDQTNIDFYKVVELVGKVSVKIIPVGSKIVREERGAQYVVPSDYVRDYDVLLGVNDRNDYEPDVKPVVKRAKNGSVTLESGYYYASKWDGSPRYETAPGWGH